MKILTHAEVYEAAEQTAQKVRKLIDTPFNPQQFRIYGIPRGGVLAAYLVDQFLGKASVLVEDPAQASVFVDDIIDSGKTRDEYKEQYPQASFFALIDKSMEYTNEWVVMPWEQSIEVDSTHIFTRLLEYIQEDPTRQGLQETPSRASKAWKEWTSGYGTDPKDVLKCFEDGAENYDEIILVRSIPFYSHCEHHLAPIFGEAHIAYIPNGRIVGLSKLSRVLDAYAKRLQVQERLTNQVACAINEVLKPKGVGVVLEARHLCMESRGICKQGHITVTSSLYGVFREDSRARKELFDLLQSQKGGIT